MKTHKSGETKRNETSSSSLVKREGAWKRTSTQEYGLSGGSDEGLEVGQGQ